MLHYQDTSTITADPLPAVCPLHVGTSGYSYTEWIEAGIYPPGTQPGNTLPIYAQTFGIVELSYTWYQIPRADVLERTLDQVPPDFLFSAKLIRSLTSEVDPAEWKTIAARYREGISRLLQTGRLVAVLAQFDTAFDRCPTNRKYLAELLDALEDLPLAIEFRNRSWAQDRVFVELERRKITLVTVDMPDLPGLFPTLNVVTNPNLMYVRFHGRNASAWRTGNMMNKFKYDYSDTELMELLNSPVAEMAQQAGRGVIIFNNHAQGLAVNNAKTLMTMLESE